MHVNLFGRLLSRARLVTSPVVAPPQAEPARRAATGLRPDRLDRGRTAGIGPYRHEVQGEKRRCLQKGQETRKRTIKSRGDGQKPLKAGGVGFGVPQRVRQGCEASAGLKIEGAKDVQRVESLAEKTNRLARKETRTGPTKLYHALQHKLTSWF